MYEKLKVDPIFTDNMVLQREKLVTVYGKAVDNSVINVEVCGQKKITKSHNGQWSVVLDPLKAGGPYEMIISGCNEAITLKNILVGDVFLAAGQSNMEFMLKESLDAKEVIAKCDYKFLRYYDVPRIDYEDENRRIPNLPEGKWVHFDKGNCSTFSAVAYYFAVKLYEELQIPIGIIGCNQGGTSASCWMAEEYLHRDKQIEKSYIDTFYDDIKGMSEEEQDARTAEYEKILAKYNKEVEEYQNKYPERSRSRLKSDLGHTPWPPPNSLKCFSRPSGLYSTMFKKISCYKFKAVLWYQGEEDTKFSHLYEKLLTFLIENWRHDFNDESMPFICVQLPYYNDDKPEGAWPNVREAQTKVSKKLDNVFLVVATDCGEEGNIHPVEKRKLGERMALSARKNIYKEDIDVDSPFYKSFEIKDNKIYIDFTESVRDCDEIKGFEISEDGENFVEAKGHSCKGQVIIEGKVFKEIRYGWRNCCEVNLFGENGMPAAPFELRMKLGRI